MLAVQLDACGLGWPLVKDVKVVRLARLVSLLCCIEISCTSFACEDSFGINVPCKGGASVFQQGFAKIKDQRADILPGIQGLLVLACCCSGFTIAGHTDQLLSVIRT